MNHQITNQEQKKHFLHFHITPKTLRFTTALCAAAMLAGGVVYAATPVTAAASEPAAVSADAEPVFTDILITAYDENEFPSSDLVRLNASVDETGISMAVINSKMDEALENLDRIPSGWPLESRIVSTEFNPTANPSISDGRKHKGMDISTRSQIIPIYATASGTVVTANYHHSYGKQVIIDHGNGYTTLYAHCNDLMVSAGDTVQKGDTIATTGSTGWSTGIHLHYEILLDGVHQNPRDYLS